MTDFTGSATATDNCDASVTITQSPTVGIVISTPTQLITLTATDDAGNTNTCTFTITLTDDTDPTFTLCPSNTNVPVGPTCSYAITDFTGMATATDNCDASVTITQSPAVGTNVTGNQIVTLTATDDAGNTSTCTFNISVIDSTDPAFTTCPANSNVSANASCQYVMTDFASLAAATDNCDTNVTITQSPSVGTVISGTSQLVTLTAEDNDGNTSTCTFTITLVDDTDPTFTLCPTNSNVSANASCQYVMIDFTGGATATDNCDASITITQSPTVGTIISTPTQLITLTATDDTGNTSTCTFTITVIDDTDPVFTLCPSNTSAPAGLSCSYTVIDFTSSATATDNCNASVTITQSPAAGTVVSATSQLITLTATDDAGNQATCSFTVSITDTTNPTFTSCPADANVQVGSLCNYTLADFTVTASANDNCDASVSITQSPAIGTVLTGVGSVHAITLTATDDAGNTSTCIFNITLTDDIDPVISTLPNITVQATSTCEAIATWLPPIATDNCGTPSLNSNFPSGHAFPFGLTTVTYTATDVNGNFSTMSFTVTVEDHVLPTISPMSDITVSAAADCHTIVTWAAPTANDNCEIFSLTPDVPGGSEFDPGSTTVTYTATDIHGNSSTMSFDVIVEDYTAPQISCNPSLTVQTTNGCGANVTIPDPQVADCSTATVTSSHPSDFFPIGTTTVNFTATDADGNTSSCSMDVTVEDKTAPVFSNCSSTIQVTTETCDAVINWSAPTATDNCGTVNITSIHNPGSTFAIGTTQVIYTATDSHGNISTCAFDVIVTGGNGPVISDCPADIPLRVGSSGQTEVNWTAPTASVGCGTVTLTSSHQPGDIFSLGTTEVTYTATDQSGRSVSCSFNVTIWYEDIQFDISKIVTPNNDGINDVWTLTNIENFADNEVTVVDRWGGLIFSGKGYDNSSVVWDGRSRNGSGVPTGTYFYTITVRLGGSKVQKTGFIELIR